ncbi:MAG: extensin family protein [Polyangiales bacterium]
MRPPFVASLALSLLGLSACCAQAAQLRSSAGADATHLPPHVTSTRTVHTRLADERHAGGDRGVPAARPISVGRNKLPSGRAVSELSERECRRILRNADVRFDPIPREQAPSISSPVALRSALLGVRFEPVSGDAKNGMVDCRLAAALLAWAPILRDAGVERVQHFSTYRPGARVRSTGKTSGHAHALAIDAARFFMADGRVLEVDLDWDERERNGDPCPVRRSEDADGRILRQVVCRAVERDLFQVVITPHHDRDHQNHVHLELVPGVDWSYIK